MQLTVEMMVPVLAVARFMATGEDAGIDDAVVEDGLVVVENFPPFLFVGICAYGRWRDGFEMHRIADGLTDLRWRFGEAQDLALEGDAAYFVLPTTWTGRSHGRAFSEDGGWAFVLVEDQGRWRIRSYAWAVTSKR